MSHNRSPSRAGLEEVLVFVQAHLAPEMSPADARRILTSLVRGPEAVIDLWDEQGRLAAAAVVDTCTSADDVAELALLGLRERELSAQALEVLFACAEELTRQGPRSALDLSLAPERRPWEPFLRARGYTPAFTEYVMERDARPPPLAPRTPLPTRYQCGEGEVSGIPQDHRRAAGLYKRACEGGSPMGCVNLGVYSLQGRGVPQDHRRAAELYAKGCEGGVAIGCGLLAGSYRDGLGVPQDDRRAAKLYERTCELGEASACQLLGLFYLDGRGVPKDEHRAAALFEKACRAGISEACTSR